MNCICFIFIIDELNCWCNNCIFWWFVFMVLNVLLSCWFVDVRKDEKCFIWCLKVVGIRLFCCWIFCIDFFKLFMLLIVVVLKRVLESLLKKGRNDFFCLDGFGVLCFGRSCLMFVMFVVIFLREFKWML